MTERTCVACGATFTPVHRGGPPRRRCYACSPYQPEKAQRRGSCTVCAKRIFVGPGSRPAGEAKCRDCWRAEVVHGSVKRGYRKGCRCSECREANNAENRASRARRKEREGLAQRRRKTRTYVHPPQPLRPCSSCSAPTRSRGVDPMCKPCSVRARRSVHLSDADRRAIYERDGWICGFCSEAVDPDLSGAEEFGPTLDHIAPRSLGGADDPSNLRLVHRWCNTVRSNNAALTIEEMAAQ